MLCIIILFFICEANVSFGVYVLGKAVLLAKGSGNLDFSSVLSLIIRNLANYFLFLNSAVMF